MCTRTRSPLLRFRESSTPPLLVDGSAISSCAKRKVGGSMLKTCRSRPSHERVVLRGSLSLRSGDIRAAHKLDISPEDVRYWTLLDNH